MTASLPIQPVTGPIDATVILPGSKSITNRALMLATLALGASRIEHALFSHDTRHMAECLERLGIPLRGDEAKERFEIAGTGGRIPASEADLYAGNSGTTARFLTALLSLGHGTYRVDGNERMRQRPIQDLLDALNALGVDARSETGCPPVRIRSNGLEGGRIALRGDVSSQFLSALLMVAPLSRIGMEIEIEGTLASRPYVEMTLRMMEQWGITAENDAYRRFRVAGCRHYEPRIYAVEPDASAASYFFAAAAVTGGRVTVPGLTAESLQGDAAFADILEQMGCSVERRYDSITVCGPGKLRGVDVDMNPISDTVMTLAAIAPFAEGATRIRNVAHIRHKETDRIHALAAELGRIGVRVDERPDGLTIYPAETLQPAEIVTYDDHRMAMSFAITGLCLPGIVIKNPGCVAKTFPGYFDKLSSLRA